MLILPNFAKFCKNGNILTKKNEITELCKGVHCVDLGESYQTHIFLQNLASIQPRTSLSDDSKDHSRFHAWNRRCCGAPRRPGEGRLVPQSGRAAAATSRKRRILRNAERSALRRSYQEFFFRRDVLKDQFGKSLLYRALQKVGFDTAENEPCEV